MPVLLWKISPQNEKALDRYEGWPHLYRKENLEVEIEGKNVSAMVYVMNDGRQAAMPHSGYYSVIVKGYETAGMDEDVLKMALRRTKEVMKQERSHRIEEPLQQYTPDTSGILQMISGIEPQYLPHLEELLAAYIKTISLAETR